MAEPASGDKASGPLRALFENNHAVMLLIDPETGAIEDANPAACSFYGWTCDELKGRTIHEINTLGQAELSAELKRAAASERGYFRFCHRKADGSVADVEVYSGPAVVDGRSLLLSIVHDITARTAAEANLQESEARLRRAEEVAGLGHWAIALGEEEMYASEGARKLYGVGSEPITLEQAQRLVVYEHRPILDEALRALIEEGAPYDVEFQVRCPEDGHVIDVHSIAEFDAETRTVFGTIQDITARKIIENELLAHQERLEHLVVERTRELEQSNVELRQASEAKSVFLANMSHELRTPLNSVIGFSGTLLQELPGPLNEEQRTQVLMVSNAGKHLLELVSEVLDFAHVEAGKLRVDIKPFDVREVVETVAAAAVPIANEQGIDLETTFDVDAASKQFFSDKTRVEQVLSNLVGNALKFTPTGSVHVATICRDGWCEFRVSDTGVGIPADELDSVFEEYYQVKQQQVAKSRGVGLGLPLSRRLAELLGGTVTATSELSVGSEFVVRLPSHGNREAQAQK